MPTRRRSRPSSMRCGRRRAWPRPRWPAIAATSKGSRAGATAAAAGSAAPIARHCSITSQCAPAERLFAAQQCPPAVGAARVLRPSPASRRPQRRPDRLAGAAEAAALAAQGAGRERDRRLARRARHRHAGRAARPRDVRTDVCRRPARQRTGELPATALNLRQGVLRVSRQGRQGAAGAAGRGGAALAGTLSGRSAAAAGRQACAAARCSSTPAAKPPAGSSSGSW